MTIMLLITHYSLREIPMDLDRSEGPDEDAAKGSERFRVFCKRVDASVDFALGTDRPSRFFDSEGDRDAFSPRLP